MQISKNPNESLRCILENNQKIPQVANNKFNVRILLELFP